MHQCARLQRTLLVPLLLVVCAAAAAAAVELPTQAIKPTFIAVGDGLTEGAFSRKQDGWGLQLQERYVRKADVVNRGFGGYFTSWMVDYQLDQLFNVANPTLAILFLGTKDTLTQAVSGSHYISPEQFGANVDKILQAGEAAGVKHFLIVTPPPVCEACKKDSPKPWDRENAHSKLYVDQLATLATKHGAAFVNIFAEWQKDPGWADKLLHTDKLHLSSAGNSLLCAQILAALDTQLPAVAWANLPLHYPLMDAIDKDDPATAFNKVKHSSKKNLRTAGTADDGQQPALAASSSMAGTQEQGQQQQGQQQQQQQRASSSATGLAVQGASWLLLAAVTAWQVCFM